VSASVLPAWELKVRGELASIDPRLLVVYEAIYDHFHGDVDSCRLRLYLLKHGHGWADKDKSTYCRWRQRIEEVRTKWIYQQSSTQL